MLRLNIIIVSFIFFAAAAHAQSSTGAAFFNRIAEKVKAYRIDTSDAPADKITQKIIELRQLKGGFNINEAIEYKIEEEKRNGKDSTGALDSLAIFFKTGNGKRWLDNATIWIYRQHFSYDELKDLARFYSSQAGQKMAADFPLIMVETLTAAETIKSYGMKKGQ
jgi:hypothetical protein